jgi:hypothetical protein
MAVEPTSAASIDPLPGKCGFFSQRLKRLCRGDAVEGMPMCALHLQYASAEVAACAEAVRGAFGEHMHVCKHSPSLAARASHCPAYSVVRPLYACHRHTLAPCSFLFRLGQAVGVSVL